MSVVQSQSTHTYELLLAKAFSIGLNGALCENKFCMKMQDEMGKKRMKVILYMDLKFDELQKKASKNF